MASEHFLGLAVKKWVYEFTDLITLPLQDFAKHINYVWLVIYKNYHVTIRSEYPACL